MNPHASPPSSSEYGPSVQLTTDAIIASYIHEISDRHRPADTSASLRLNPATTEPRRRRHATAPV
jgi:hypothetical protein